MANFKIHDVVGTAAGAGYAAIRSTTQDPLLKIVQIVAGGMGGSIGGRLPDILEPATWPGHRNTAHSVACGTLLLKSSVRVERWSVETEASATQLLMMATPATIQSQPPSQYFLGALLLTFAVGLVNGIIAGYLSHIALDGCTPAGIPLLLSE